MKASLNCLLSLFAGLALLAPAQAEEASFKETLRSPVDPAIPAYQPSEQELAGSLLGVGTDTMDEVMKGWIAGFTKFYPMVTLTNEAKGSMTAEPALTSGRSQFSALSREFMPEEMSRFKAKHGYEPFVVKVALGSYRTPTKTVALTFYVHESNPLKQLTFAQLDAIYCTDRKRGYPEDLKTWGQLGLTGEWANRPIKLVGVMQPDGISNYIRLLIGEDGELKKGIYEEKIDHSEGAVSVLTRIVQDVAKDPAAIGYAGFNNRVDGAKPVALAVTAKGPFLMGSFEEVASARFPLTRYIYICVDRPPGKPLDPKLKAFLKYVLSNDGQKVVENEGVFMPLPASVADQERRRLN